VRKEQASWKKIETRAVNVCRSGLSPEYVEDLETDETLLWIYKVEYKTEDKLFITRILLESATEDLYTTSTISQKLVEGACQASETQKRLPILLDCAKGFKSVFAKDDFNILLEHK